MRVFLTVIDSFGIGAMPDADKFGDTFLDHRFGAMGFFAEFFGR